MHQKKTENNQQQKNKTALVEHEEDEELEDDDEIPNKPRDNFSVSIPELDSSNRSTSSKMNENNQHDSRSQKSGFDEIPEEKNLKKN